MAVLILMSIASFVLYNAARFINLLSGRFLRRLQYPEQHERQETWLCLITILFISLCVGWSLNYFTAPITITIYYIICISKFYLNSHQKVILLQDKQANIFLILSILIISNIVNIVASIEAGIKIQAITNITMNFLWNYAVNLFGIFFIMTILQIVISPIVIFAAISALMIALNKPNKENSYDVNQQLNKGCLAFLFMIAIITSALYLVGSILSPITYLTAAKITSLSAWFFVYIHLYQIIAIFLEPLVELTTMSIFKLSNKLLFTLLPIITIAIGIVIGWGLASTSAANM
jgi:hypothetical protein